MIQDNIHPTQIKKYIPLFILLTLFGIGVLVGTLMTQQNQDNRNKAAVAEGTATIYSPVQSVYPPGNPTSVPILVNTSGGNVDGVQLVFTLSGTIPPDFTFTKNSALTNLEMISATDSANIYQIALVTTDATVPFNTNTTPVEIGRYSFTNPASGTFFINYDQTLTRITKHTDGQDVLALPTNLTFSFAAGPTPTTAPPTTPPTISPTVSPSSNPYGTPNPATIRIKTKLRGVNSDVGPISMNVKLGHPNMPTILENQTLTFTHTTGGVYESSFNTSNHNMTNLYWISLKAEKHLARSLTNITLVHDMTIDFTSKILEPGDLPAQDGVVDDNDIDKVLAIFAKPTQTQADLDIADVNYDGTVNSIDIGLILSTLSVKPDESPF